MKPTYNLDKIKFATDEPTFERAIGLYEGEKVTKFKKELNGFSAIVLGTKSYKVYVDGKHYDQGDCECYLGQNNTLCKHMVAVAIYAVMKGKSLSKEEKEFISTPMCSNRVGELSKEKLAETKKSITSEMKYIKSYVGPSRNWFAYQDLLMEGCNRLAAIVSKLPVSEQTTKLLINMLLRLDKKLCTGGVDDSDGTVSEFIYETVDILREYAELDPSCINAFEKLCGQSTCFDWEESLVKILDEQ